MIYIYIYIYIYVCLFCEHLKVSPLVTKLISVYCVGCVFFSVLCGLCVFQCIVWVVCFSVYCVGCVFFSVLTVEVNRLKTVQCVFSTWHDVEVCMFSYLWLVFDGLICLAPVTPPPTQVPFHPLFLSPACLCCCISVGASRSVLSLGTVGSLITCLFFTCQGSHSLMRNCV